jgi:hypothetical protein
MTAQADLEEPQPEPTLSATTAVELRGWATDDAASARLFGEKLLALTLEYSRWLDLSRLSRIVLAYDYRAALAEFQGDDAAPLGVATSNEYGEGAAMSLLSAEGGVLTSILVVHTPLIASMFDEADTREKRTALQSFVHELVHVDDQAFLDRTFPGGGCSAIQRDDRHGALLLMVSPAQAEYSAAKRTAMIEPATGFDFFDMLERVMARAVAEVREQRLRYQLRQIPLETFWPWVQERGRFIFQALGYAVGHADGVLKSDAAADDLKAQYRARLSTIEDMELGWLVGATREAIRPILDQPQWTGLEVFDALIEVGERLLNRFGLWTRLENGMLYVDVPLQGRGAT